MNKNELYHSEIYLGTDFSDGIRHWKYIKREMVNGKWVYYYNDDQLNKANSSYKKNISERDTYKKYEKSSQDTYNEYKNKLDTATKNYNDQTRKRQQLEYAQSKANIFKKAKYSDEISKTMRDQHQANLDLQAAQRSYNDMKIYKEYAKNAKKLGAESAALAEADKKKIAEINSKDKFRKNVNKAAIKVANAASNASYNVKQSAKKAKAKAEEFKKDPAAYVKKLTDKLKKKKK